jgi:hypothetical protein
MVHGSAKFYLTVPIVRCDHQKLDRLSKPLPTDAVVSDRVHLMPAPRSEPRAARPIAERIALSLVVGYAADLQVVLIKCRFSRGATETIHVPKAVAATLLDGLTAAGSEKAVPWDAASLLNVNAQRLLAVAYPRLTDEDSDPALADRATDIRLGIADKGAIVEFILSDGASRIVGFTPTVARYLREQLHGLREVEQPGGEGIPTQP